MKKIVIILSVLAAGFILFGLLSHKKKSGIFSTLSDAVAFTRTTPEYPEIDNEDWWDPDFSSFYRTKDPGFLSSLLRIFGLQKTLWSIDSFNELLDTVSRAREKNGYFGRFIVKMTPEASKKFVMWGNIQGALHSLVRDLQELEILGVLSNDFRILDPSYYFVFTGNVIDRSAYNMETLTLVLQLLKNNPKKVFYLRGTHEDREMWHNFGLKRELNIRAFGQEVDLDIPYGEKFRKFFNTLPLALYLVGERDNKGVSVVRITNDGVGDHDLQEENYSQFLYDEQEVKNPTEIFKLNEESRSKKKVRISAIIKSNHVKQKYYRNDGLRLLLPEKESTTWAILSAPTGSYRRLFGFFYDAFTVLTIGDHLKNWTISLYRQDVREMLGFELRRTMGLVSGIRVDTKLGNRSKLSEINEAIIIGSTMDLSRGLKRMAEQLREGLMMPLKEQNEKGGIKNRRITLVVKNDFYIPSVARENIESFLEEGITIIICPQGTANLENYLDLIEEKKLLVLFPAGIPDEKLDYLIRFGPSYNTEGRILTDYAINQLGAKRISFFYQHDKFGSDTMNGAKEALKAAGVTDFNEIKYERNDLEFAEQVESIKAFDQDAIIFFAIPAVVEELIRQVGIENIAYDQLLGISDLNSSGMNNFLTSKGLRMTVSTVVPNPRVSTMPIVERYRKEFDTLQLPYNTVSLRGYICSSILIYILNKRMKYPFELAKIVEILEGIKQYNLDGFPLNFNPETRELSNNLWVHTIPDDKLEPWDRYDVTTDQFIPAQKAQQPLS